MWTCQFVKVEVILILALNIIVLHEYATIEVSAQKSEICANLGISTTSIYFNMKLATVYTTRCTNQSLPMSFLGVGNSRKWKSLREHTCRSYQESKGEEFSNSNFCYNQLETETKQKTLKFGNL